MSGFQPVSEEIVFEGWILRVAKGRFQAPDGSEFERDIVHHPGAVAAVPIIDGDIICLLYTSPSPRDRTRSRMPSSA